MSFYVRLEREKLEEVASRFIAEHGLFDNRMFMLEQVVENLGYRITPVQGLAEIAEAYIPIEKGRIFVDEDQYMGAASLRFRFTLAEELAHELIHRPLFAGKSPKEIQSIQSAISDDEYQDIERDAKHLAAAILMPKREFEERFRFHEARQRKRTSNDIEVNAYTIRHLHLDFVVSRLTAAYRARNLNLIDYSELQELLEASGPNSSPVDCPYPNDGI